MKLNDLAKRSISEIVSELQITKLEPISDDKGNVRKIIIEYTPIEELTVIRERREPKF